MPGGKKPVNKEERNPKLVNRERYITNLLSMSQTQKNPQLDVLMPSKIPMSKSLDNFDRNDISFRNQPPTESHPFRKEHLDTASSLSSNRRMPKKEQRVTRCTPSNLTPAQSKPFSNFVKTKPWSSKVPTKVLALW